MTTTELAQNMGKVMKRVIAGESFTLTSNGTVVAQLSPVVGVGIDEQKQDAAGNTAGQARTHAAPNGRDAQDGAKRNQQNRIGRDAAKRPNRTLGKGVSTAR